MTETKEERAARLGLEPVAISCHCFDDSSEKGAYESEVEASKAVSLKRIADTLEFGLAGIEAAIGRGQ